MSKGIKMAKNNKNGDTFRVHVIVDAADPSTMKAIANMKKMDGVKVSSSSLPIITDCGCSNPPHDCPGIINCPFDYDFREDRFECIHCKSFKRCHYILHGHGNSCK